jgi:hypothetical protein
VSWAFWIFLLNALCCKTKQFALLIFSFLLYGNCIQISGTFTIHLYMHTNDGQLRIRMICSTSIQIELGDYTMADYGS